MSVKKSLGALTLCIGLFFGTACFAKSEAEYVKENCTGQIEYRLPDATRVDCLTETHAYEFDFCNKWAESVGQALYYADLTEKKPGIVLICDADEQRFYYRAMVACPECRVEIVPK